MKAFKKMSSGLLFSTCALLFSFVFIKKDNVRVTNWMNKNYIKCLENKLPCECEKEVGTYFVMHLDTIHSAIVLLKHDLVEEERFRIEKESKNSYKIIDISKDVQKVVGKLIVKGSELLILGFGHKTIVFDYYGTSAFSNDIEYFKQNISLLNRAFIKRGYDSLQITLKDTSLNCHCNNDLAKMNFIWNDSESKSWILEIKKGSLYVNTLTKKGDSIFTKKITAYRWK